MPLQSRFPYLINPYRFQNACECPNKLFYYVKLRYIKFRACFFFFIGLVLGHDIAKTKCFKMLSLVSKNAMQSYMYGSVYEIFKTVFLNTIFRTNKGNAKFHTITFTLPYIINFYELQNACEFPKNNMCLR